MGRYQSVPGKLSAVIDLLAKTHTYLGEIYISGIVRYDWTDLINLKIQRRHFNAYFMILSGQRRQKK